MSGGKNPTRNYAIEYILRGAGLTIGQATAAAAAISTVTTADATGAVYGDVVGALLGPLLVQGIHGDELTKVLAADLDDWDPGADSLILRLDFAGFALSGMAAPDSPGEVRIIVAVSGGTLTHEDAGSTDVNRFLCSSGTDVSLADDGVAVVLYDGTSTRWRVISGGASVAAAEDGVVVVAAPTEFDFRHGLDVTNPGGGPVRIAVDEAELSGALIPGVPSDAEGAIAIRYTFDTTTTDSDPGAGKLRLSNATEYLAVTARCDLADIAGADVTALLALIGDQVSTTKGYLRLQHTTDPTKWLEATVSAIASPSGYKNITIANIAKSANSPFANGDPVTLIFVPGALPHHAAHEVGGTDAVAITHAQTTGQTANDHHNRDHASTHGPAAADALKLDDLAAPDNNTDLNASASAHGLLPKLSGVATDRLAGDGTFVAGAGTAATAASSGDVTTTSSLADATGCSVSLSAGTYIVLGVFDVLVNSNADRTFEGHLDVGGSDQTRIAPLVAVGLDTSDRQPIIQAWLVTVAATTTVKLRAKHSGGTAGDFTVKANSFIAAYTAGGSFGEWVTYTPTWTSNGTAPSIGNGTLTGRYRVLDKNTVHVIIRWVRGSTSSNGTGTYNLGLPAGFPIASDTGMAQLGSARYLISGIAHLASAAHGDPAATSLFLFIADNTNTSRNMIWQQTYPQNPATGDEVNISMIYRYA
jgi:hypothetical protein